ncbi:MAG: hypothetical protein HQL92_02565 [Magnetococcales bacterium]|nr:hypothetical protein [Magnetococcales bacterium]
MIMHANKRKSATRWVTAERTHSRFGRPSILENQKVQPRTRNRLQEILPEANRMERAASVARENGRRRAAAASSHTHPFGVRLLEEGVVLAAGLSMMFRNSFEQIVTWFRESRDKLWKPADKTPYAWEPEPLEEPRDTLEEEVWDGDRDLHMLDEFDDAHPPEPQPMASAKPSWFDFLKSPLRRDVEQHKVYSLDVEEQDLPDEELEDQAGALRTRLGGASRLD